VADISGSSMKVGVISDTHVPAVVKELPSAIFDIFKDVELILHAGDLVELSVLYELKAIAPVEAVAGNMDGIEIQKTLPAKKIVEIGRFRVGLIHGQGKVEGQMERIRREFDAVDLIVFGHSHTPFWGRVGDVLFLNPGSPTDKRWAPYNSVAILEVGDNMRAEIIRI
jgi:putative phosphoesterase